MSSSVTPLFFALLLTSFAAPAAASHYLLADVPDVVAAEHHPALAKAGVTNTAQLYERVVTRMARGKLAKETGISSTLLTDWARFIDLMQLGGIGPKMVRLLNAAGVATLRDLRTANAESVNVRMKSVNRGGKYSEIVPPSDVIQGWIDASKRVTPRLE